MAVLLLGPIAIACAHEGMPGMSDMPGSERLGTVAFENSCKPGVKADFNRAVALLHSFWLDEAQRTFEKVATADPDCAIAYWGEAIADLHQINGEPSPSDLTAGRAALAKAASAREVSPREAGYLKAVHVLYDGYEATKYFDYARRYAEAMGALSAAYPTDLEAKLFYALALLAADPPDDTALKNPKMAVAILNPLLRAYPGHPGIAHYIIHASDNPKMAEQGLDAARRYAAIAPSSPHALHMPSHIFARLGLWQDDIRSNLASKTAAEAHGGRHVGAEDRLHAMEFLEYAYLQIGRDDEAHKILDEARTVKANDVDPAYPDYWGIVEARFPMLFSIETEDWVAAEHLQPVTGGDTLSGGLTLLAHAIAAGHRRDGRAGNEAARSYDVLLSKEPVVHPGGSLATVRDEIHAWADFSRGDLAAARQLLRPIAERQRQVGKGEVELPAGEMLADMLLLQGNAPAALQGYRISLLSDPNRFNALLGAGRAAELSGQIALAARYYRALLANCGGASGAALRVLEHAQAIIAKVPN
jgi:tetratricopeptide (TPR) repeat protein